MQTQRRFITFTTHHINADWKLAQQVLFTTEYQEEKKDALSIRYMIKTQLLHLSVEFNVDPDIQMKKLSFVTDQEGSLINAIDMEHCKRYRCYAHILNSVLRNAFAKNAFPDVQSIITTCKELVTDFKQTGKMRKLKTKLVQSVETRWNSNLAMLVSIFKQFDNINEILSEDGDQFGIDKDKLQDLIRNFRRKHDFHGIYEISYYS